MSPEVTEILKELQTPKPLPLGVAEFHEWSERIIGAAMITADIESQKFALSDMIIHLNPTEDHKEDGYFVKMLRKTAVNQIADHMRTTIRDEFKKRASEAAKPSDVTPTEGVSSNVLEETRV